ncbi:phage resistance protein [Carbonactinospora thermoautotrophica]|uniref:hypothetical protein n=1 Tax=Carbonactinospora thermoautotrophica TaxID=1469144 RepID=UPI002271B962|nr:hypothetical protein [Carbonactinospora thermoautotrophica]MCX9191369.1 phage resistance protein [Carbonactinospora thermoautotrophica]
MTTLLRDLIEIPERVHAGDLVLKLSTGVEQASATVRDYVVTPQLAQAFDRALGIIQAAVENKTSYAAYLDGSFGSGKSHFMAMLHALLQGDPEARSKDLLVPVVAKHDAWLKGRKFLLIPYHLVDSSSLESAILGGYVNHVRKLHPDKPLPAVYLDDLLLENARELRRSMGDERFIAGLPAGDDEWGLGWTPETLDAALAAPPGDEERQRLVGDLLATHLKSYVNVVKGDVQSYVPLDDGLSLISRHAKDVLGYDAVVLLLDELVLWLGSQLGNQAFVSREAQKVAKLVESAESYRPAPIVSFVPRQRDLRELVGRDVAGAEASSLFDVLKYWDGRFDRIRLEDRNLPMIVEARLLRPKSDEAKAELDAAFERATRTQPAVWETLLDAQGGQTSKEDFRRTYPFSPAFLHAMIDISGALQRERTALKLMQELLVMYRDTLPVGQLVPLGAIYDVLVSGGDRPFTDKLREEFEQAKRFYIHRVRPYLLAKHKLTEDETLNLPPRHRFRADDLIVKTLLLAALVPNVPALRTLTARRLAALNHGSIVSMIPGREAAEVAKTLRELAAEFGEIRVSDGDDPRVEVALIGVDTKSILDQARGVDDAASRRNLLRDLLWQELGVQDTGEFVTRHRIVWRGTSRTVELVFGNIRDAERLPSEAFTPSEPGAIRVVIDYPFDEGNFGPADDRNRVLELQAEGKHPMTVCWLPAFLSEERLGDLGELVVISYVLQRDRLDELAAHYTAEERHHARTQLESRRSALTTRLREALKRAYGVASHDPADLGRLPDEHVMCLDSSLEIKPAAGLGLGEALERICFRLLEHRYPQHPDFDPEGRRQEFRLKDLETTLRAVEQAAQDPVGRYEPPRADIPVIRRIANPLGIGTMHEAAFVLADTWRVHIERSASQAGMTGDLSVGRIRDWIRDEQPGLPDQIVDLVVAAYAVQADRTWVRAGQVMTSPPGLRQITGDMALRAVPVPDPEEFAAANERAASVFGLAKQPVRTARSVQQLGEQIRRKAGELLPDAEALVRELERYREILGLDERSERLATARAAAGLLGRLAGMNDHTELLRALAAADLPRPGEVYRVSLEAARSLVAAMGNVRWELLEGLAEDAATGDGQARVILDRLSDAATRDEHALALAPALQKAQQESVELLRSRSRKLDREVVVPPPRREETDREDKRITLPRPRSGQARVRVAELNSVIEKLRQDMKAHPDAEVVITWTIVEGSDTQA